MHNRGISIMMVGFQSRLTPRRTRIGVKIAGHLTTESRDDITKSWAGRHLAEEIYHPVPVASCNYKDHYWKIGTYVCNTTYDIPKTTEESEDKRLFVRLGIIISIISIGLIT